jgi:hypothetical protein
MSSVGLKAALAVYGEYAPARTLEGLLHGVAEGRRLYGPRVSKIYCYIAELEDDEVQLFYCQNPGEEERIASSRDVRERTLVYSNGEVLACPFFLQEAFDTVAGDSGATRTVVAKDPPPPESAPAPVAAEPPPGPTPSPAADGPEDSNPHVAHSVDRRALVLVRGDLLLESAQLPLEAVFIDRAARSRHVG